MIEKDDWRLLNEVGYLKGKNINPTRGVEISKRARYLKKCAFCWDKVDTKMNLCWYVPEDMSCCICDDCYDDFKEMFEWKKLDGHDIDWTVLCPRCRQKLKVTSIPDYLYLCPDCNMLYDENFVDELELNDNLGEWEDDTFEDISIMGRAVYIIYSIELYLEKKGVEKEWKKLLDTLWSFSEKDMWIDEYSEKVIECMPDTLFDDREDFSTFEYFQEDELYELRELYTKFDDIKVIDYLISKIDDIIGYNLYTSVNPPEKYSLEVINETYQYIKRLLGKDNPSIKPFKIYSIFEGGCWGHLYSREELEDKWRNYE